MIEKLLERDTIIATVEADEVVDTYFEGQRYYPTSYTAGTLQTSDDQTNWQAVTASANERVDPVEVLARYVRLNGTGGQITMRAI